MGFFSKGMRLAYFGFCSVSFKPYFSSCSVKDEKRSGKFSLNITNTECGVHAATYRALTAMSRSSAFTSEILNFS